MKRNCTRTLAAWALLALAGHALAQARGGAAHGAIDDPSPALEHERQAWQQQYNQALRMHLRSVAAQGDPLDLYLAALLWPGHDPSTGGATGPEQEPRAWMQAAIQARPRHPLVARGELKDSLCARFQIICDADGALTFLLQREADNAEVHLAAMQEADSRGDMAAVDRHWQAAAAASTFHPPVMEIAQAAAQRLGGVQVPDMPTRLAQASGSDMRLQGPFAAQDIAAVMALGLSSAHALPNFKGPTSRCDTARVAADAARATQCIHFFELMAADPSTLLSPLVALTQLRRLTEATPVAAASRERLRQFYWLQENGQRLIWPVDAARHAATAQYLDWVIGEGEVGAMRRVLAFHQVPQEAPADWMPDNPQARMRLAAQQP